MRPRLDQLLLRLTARRRSPPEPAPLLLELFERAGPRGAWEEKYPFAYRITMKDSAPYYEVGHTLPFDLVMRLRTVVAQAASGLDPREVEPLTFSRLVEVLVRRSTGLLAPSVPRDRVRALAELAAYEAIGLSRLLAIAKDDRVTEFFTDSDFTPIYLDHAAAGRCESGMVLTERERDSIRTHLDTFSGYTLDFKTPSLKNDLPIGGAILRVSLDLEPVSVNRFALDVRRLNVSSLSLPGLISLGVLTTEAAGLLVGWLEAGGNLTIIGETGSGKTTLLNALDEQVERRLRRLYIEDAVETKDLLQLGFHQLKLKVDPFERGDESGRTKEAEIVKSLHRSPDIVVLSEIQSEEHSRAFFQALAAGARGMQTFHASTPEQAVRRWVNMHKVSVESLSDLGILVQMARPDRLRQERYVQRVCALVGHDGAPEVKDVFARDQEFRLARAGQGELPPLPNAVDKDSLHEKIALATERIRRAVVVRT